VILRLYAKHAPSSYVDVTNCQFLLNNSEALSSTLINIIKNEEEPLIAYQIAFDLVDNQNPFYLKQIVEIIKKLGIDHKVEESRLMALCSILDTSVSRKVTSYSFNKMNKSDPNIMKNLMKAVEKGGSVPHLAVIIANSIYNSHTKNDSFLKENIEWCAKATNWAKFTASASMGVIHMGNLEKGFDVIKPFMPGSSSVPSIYAQAGSFYALGLIYSNTNDEKILNFLLDELNKPANNRECFQHGLFLAIGLVAMSSHNEQLYERLRDGMYTDDAIIGEAAGYAIGLVMMGSRNEQAIEDLVTYSHDTQHEKIIRAIALSLSLIVYGSAEAADALIEQLTREKDPILRYGAMYCIGMAYAGTANSSALKKLIKFSVSDVNDDVRRAALINIGFLNIRNPEILLENLKVINLLSESYNPHVRYGAAMALGISCAGSANSRAFDILQPLLTDSSFLVRQGALLASSLIFSQTSPSQDPKLIAFKENLEKITNDKDEHILVRFGGIIAQSITEIGGRNSTINLVSNSGNNRMGAIAGLALFTQYYYWFPMIHFLHLAARPSILFALDSNLRVVSNFKIISKAKPSVYGYPKEVKLQEKVTTAKPQAAVLSTHSRAKAKGKRTATITSIQEMQVDKVEEKKEEPTLEIMKEPDTPEPDEEVLNNPCRVLPKQLSVVSNIPNQDYSPLLNDRFRGFILLRKLNPDAVPIYFDEEKPAEENRNQSNISTQQNPTSGNNAQYQPLPTDDVEMPEEFDLNPSKK
jgi:26S proteasome regulatory subunit N2